MSIDEAIARERQLAKEQRSHIGTWYSKIMGYDDEYIKKCEVFAEEHEQLAEWLEELKAYQRQHIALCEKYCVNTIEDLYVKAIDDCIKEVEKEEKQHNHIITKDCLFWLKREFEQLKERDVK